MANQQDVVADASSLAPVMRERLRLIAPATLVTVLFFNVAAPWLGLRPPLPVAWICAGVLALETVALLAGWIGDRWIHAAAAAVLWIPLISTSCSLYVTQEPQIGLFLILGAMITGIFLDTRWVAVTLIAINALGIPLLARTGSELAVIVIAILITASSFGLLLHLLMRRALLRLELLRNEGTETVTKLARQLEQLEHSQTDRAQLHEQLVHAQRMDAIGTLAAGVAHDMNNVLASITSYATLLKEQLGEVDARGDAHEIIQQALRGAQLVRGLLAFSRRGQYRKQVVPITEVVDNVIPLLDRTLPKSITIRTGLALDGVCVEGDPVHLQQVLINFSVNAADAMSGKGTITIAGIPVELTSGEHPSLPPGRYVQLRVSDTGKGMDPSTRLRVFEPFFTTKPLGQGTGLGLSIVWGIVEAHHGAVSVESQLGQGATFQVLLPVSQREQPATQVSSPGIPVVTKPSTVLIVEDEVAVRESTKRLLEAMGLQVLTATNGQEGLHVFSQAVDLIDLIVLDMGMPVMNGAECFRHIRKLSQVPILIATGYAGESDIQELVEAGAVVLEKPFSSASLRAEVARMLQEN